MEKLQPDSILFDIILRLIKRIDAFFFPPLCIICDNPRPDNDNWFCIGCLKEMRRSIVSRNSCRRCGQNRDQKKCSCDIVWDYPFERIISFIDYNDMVKSILHQIKYCGKRKLAEYIGCLCAPFLEQSLISSGSIVIPVPLHRMRLMRRGYNQAEWFARGLFADTSLRIDSGILRRVRTTRTQTMLDRSTRLRNVSGAFGLTPKGMEVVKGRPVILVDDVVTTGSTTAAATLSLLAGGCGAVTVISFARD